MAEKKELRELVLALARLELEGRDAYRSHLLGSERAADEIERIKTSHVELLKEVNQLRRRFTEMDGKKYWWDISYDISHPPVHFPGTFSMERGILTEQEDFLETHGLEMKEAYKTCMASDLMDVYMKISGYTVLYVDRKKVRMNLYEKMSVKVICCCEEKAPDLQISEYDGPEVYQAEGTWEYQKLLKDREAVAGGIQEKMDKYNSRRDTEERILNYLDGNDLHTVEEQALRGRISTSDYLENLAQRELREDAIRRRELDEIAQIEAQMEQLRIKAAKAQAQKMKYDIKRAQSRKQGYTMRLMRCGYVCYLKEELVGIVLFTGPETVYQIEHHGTISPYSSIFGNIRSCKEVGEEIPDPTMVLPFVNREYRNRMKPFAPLSSCPQNASEQLWRYWAEMRLADRLF